MWVKTLCFPNPTSLALLACTIVAVIYMISNVIHVALYFSLDTFVNTLYGYEIVKALIRLSKHKAMTLSGYDGAISCSEVSG